MTATINIGLAIGDTGHMPAKDALDAILTITGDRPITYAVVQSNTEPTLVAVLEDAMSPLDIARLCGRLEQDCIAQKIDGMPGQLIGPNASDWGQFDPEKFIDWPTANLKAAEAEYAAATQAKEQVERERAEARKAEMAKVDADFAEAMAAATARRSAAHTAKWRAENAAVEAKPHEWEGKQVQMIEPILDRWSGRPTGRFEVSKGVVETWRNTSNMPLNAGWRHKRVQPGDAIVRALKKDGTPGLMFEFLSQTGRNGAKWELV